MEGKTQTRAPRKGKKARRRKAGRKAGRRTGGASAAKRVLAFVQKAGSSGRRGAEIVQQLTRAWQGHSCLDYWKLVQAQTAQEEGDEGRAGELVRGCVTTEGVT